MNNLISLRNLSIVLGAVTLFASCDKEFDAPPIASIPNSAVITIPELRQMFGDSGLLPVRFTQPLSVYGTITADEENGNLYKNVYMQDGGQAINVRLKSSGGLYQGDRVRIYLVGVTLNQYNGVLQLDSVDVDNNVVKQSTLNVVEPLVMTIAELNASHLNGYGLDTLQSMLVRIPDVEFVLDEACYGQPYADAVGQQSLDRNLSDCSGSIIVRSSGYANFANLPVAAGNGTFTGILGQYQGTNQLIIRNLSELDMNGTRCDPCPLPFQPCAATATVQEDFATVVSNSNINLACWFTGSLSTDNRVWRGGAFQAELFAQGSAYTSTAATTVSWLVSPNIQATGTNTLQFMSQRAFGDAGHEPFSLFICTDFDGTNLATANWVPVSSTFANDGTADFVWVNSGVVQLSGYLPVGYTGGFVVGFRYTGSGPNNQDTNFRIDDVQIN
jgi:Family of unknown function (DUF5689)/Domain of unknown function (DUF5017)